MNFASLIKPILFLVAVGTIFLVGMITGGAFATGLTQDGVIIQVEQCMPAQTAEDLRPCLTTDEAKP